MCISYLSLNIPNNNLVAKFLALRQQFDNQKMAIEDIIPLDVLFPDKGSNEFHKGLITKGKKKKIDKEAMASPMMRIPRMDVRVARDLLDVGIREFYELQGRSADSIWEEIKEKNPKPLSGHFPTCVWLSIFVKKKTRTPRNYTLKIGLSKSILPITIQVGFCFFSLPNHKKTITKKQ